MKQCWPPNIRGSSGLPNIRYHDCGIKFPRNFSCFQILQYVYIVRIVQNWSRRNVELKAIGLKLSDCPLDYTKLHCS